MILLKVYSFLETPLLIFIKLIFSFFLDFFCRDNSELRNIQKLSAFLISHLKILGPIFHRQHLYNKKIEVN